MIVSFYDADGRIRYVIQFSEELGVDFSPYTQPGGGYAEERSDPRTEYYLGGVRTARPEIEAEADYRIPADGETEIAIPLPAGTRVVANSIKGIIAPSEGEDFTYVTDIPSDDEIVFTPPFPWIGRIIRITAYAVDQ